MEAEVTFTSKMGLSLQENIRECPVFHPTVNEFRYPYDYINSLREKGEAFGMCKIVPPAIWRPPFTLDPDTYKFFAPLQSLSRLRLITRAKQIFFTRLQNYFKSTNKELELPDVNDKPLDLYELYRAVEFEGGFDSVNRKKLWPKIVKILNLSMLDSTEEKVILELKEAFEICVKPYLDHTRALEKEAKTKKKGQLKNATCEKCKGKCDQKTGGLCVECHKSFHTNCLSDEPRSSNEFLCDECFEENEILRECWFMPVKREYTLREYDDMANQFKMDYFNLPDYAVPPSEVEASFWDMMNNEDEDLYVETANDICDTSGFPEYNSSENEFPEDVLYSRDCWNLRNFWRLNDSLMRLYGTVKPISAVTIPNVSINQCFSVKGMTQNLHWGYSISYMHWGEPKIWYCIPGHEDEQFKQVSIIPDEEKKRIIGNKAAFKNDHVYDPCSFTSDFFINRVVQHSGELIIIFPRANYSTLSCGFNFSEQVNFFNADAIQYGKMHADHTLIIKKFYSHDEMVYMTSLYHDQHDIETIIAIHDHLLTIYEREETFLANVKNAGITVEKSAAFEVYPFEQRRCLFCHEICFFSGVGRAIKAKQLSCCKHFEKLGELKDVKYFYRYKMDNFKTIIIEPLSRIVDQYKDWTTQARKVLEPGDKKVHISAAQALMENEFVKKYKKTKLWQVFDKKLKEMNKCKKVIDNLDFDHKKCKYPSGPLLKITGAQLKLVAQEAESLPCRFDRMDDLIEWVEMLEEFEADAEVIFNKSLTELTKKGVQEVYDAGANLCFLDLEPLLNKLEAKRCKVMWLEEINKATHNDAEVALEKIRNWIRNALNFTPEYQIEMKISELHHILIDGESWENRAQGALEKRTPEVLTTIKTLLDESKKIRAFLPTKKKLIDYEERARVWVEKYVDLVTEPVVPLFEVIQNLYDDGTDLMLVTNERESLAKKINDTCYWLEKLTKAFLSRDTRGRYFDMFHPRYLLVNNTPKHPNLIIDDYVSSLSRDLEYIQDVRDNYNARSRDRVLDGGFCVCNSARFGPMIQCELCLNWYHDHCVNIPKRLYAPKYKLVFPDNLDVFATDYKYLCQHCMRTKRPLFDFVVAHLMSLKDIQVRTYEGDLLQRLIDRAAEWRHQAQKVLDTEPIRGAVEKLESMGNRFNDLSMRGGKKPGKIGGESKQYGDTQAVEASNQFDYILNKHGAAKSRKLQSDNNYLDSYFNNEHAYSFPCPTERDTDTFVFLDETAIIQLTDLLIESDLIELTIPESYTIWRLLQATHNIKADDKFIVNFEIPMLPSGVPAISMPKPKPRRKKSSFEPMDMLTPIKSTDFLPKKMKIMPKNGNGRSAEKKKMIYTDKDKSPVKKRAKKVVRATKNDDSDSSSGDDDNEKCAADDCVKFPVPSRGKIQVDWVQCDGCDMWYHMRCVGLKKDELKVHDEYICLRCSFEKRNDLTPRTKKNRMESMSSHQMPQAQLQPAPLISKNLDEFFEIQSAPMQATDPIIQTVGFNQNAGVSRTPLGYPSPDIMSSVFSTNMPHPAFYPAMPPFINAESHDPDDKSEKTLLSL